ncbi:hypothetical protein [Brevundimonas sp. R86498]|uniref:hypothetical protein n=1 Tax=Brevundimonas sp. R86498 TaxID=3093845 RepID=UPI0037C5A564
MTTALTKKALLSLLAASAVAIATPTLAQDHGRGHDRGYNGSYNGGWNGSGLNGEQARLAQRIDRAAYYGRISRREAAGLRYQLEEYQRIEWRYRRDGLSRWEREDLQRRLHRIERDLHDERRDRDGRRW